jgi:hypothetical protein
VGFGAGHDSDLAFVALLRAVEGAEELIMLRTLVLAVFMVTWLATGIAAGIVVGRRRHDHFPWWLLGVAFGAMMVPLALDRDRREQLTGRASSLPASPDRPVPALVGIDDRRHAALVLTTTLDRRNEEAQQP